MSTLSGVLLSFFDFLQDLANVAVLAFLNSGHFIHDILEEVLDEHFGFLVTIHALIDLNTDHLAQLVRYLNLTALESIDFVLDGIVDLSELRSQIDFLLGASHLFLPNPSVNASDLSLQIRIDRVDGLVLALEFIPDIRVHLVVAIAHFINVLSALFMIHLGLHFHLVTDVVDLARALLLLAE